MKKLAKNSLRSTLDCVVHYEFGNFTEFNDNILEIRQHSPVKTAQTPGKGSCELSLCDPASPNDFSLLTILTAPKCFSTLQCFRARAGQHLGPTARLTLLDLYKKGSYRAGVYCIMVVRYSYARGEKDTLMSGRKKNIQENWSCPCLPGPKPSVMRDGWFLCIARKLCNCHLMWTQEHIMFVHLYIVLTYLKT